MASRARSLGGHGGSGASGGHGGSGASGGHGESGASDGHGGSGIWPPQKIFLGGSPAGEYPVRASGDEGELDGTSGDEGELDGTGGDEGELDRTSGDEGELDWISGDEGELGGASGDEGKLDWTNSRGCSESADSVGRWRGAGTGGRSGRAELDGSSTEEGDAEQDQQRHR